MKTVCWCSGQWQENKAESVQVQMKPALFLDRDGVVNVEVNYAYKKEQIQWVPGLFELCKTMHARGYALIVVTNQSGVARQFYSKSDVELLTQWMVSVFHEKINTAPFFYACPDYYTDEPESSNAYRKPGAGMLLRAAFDHSIDLSKSMLIGDQWTDMCAGMNAGLLKSYWHTATTPTKALPQEVQWIQNLQQAYN